MVFSWIVVHIVILHTYTATAKPKQQNTEQANFVRHLQHYRNTQADMIAAMWTETGVHVKAVLQYLSQVTYGFSACLGVVRPC